MLDRDRKRNLRSRRLSYCKKRRRLHWRARSRSLSCPYQNAVGVYFIQHAHQWRAEECARLLFAHDDIARLRRYFLDDLVGLFPSGCHVLGGAAAFCRPAADGDRGVGAIFLSGCVESGQMFFTRFGEQLADLVNPFPSFLAATCSKTFNRFENRLGLVAGKIIIDIDDEYCGPLTEASFFAKTGKRENFFVACRKNSSQEFIEFILRSPNYAECSQQSGVDVKAIGTNGALTRASAMPYN